MVAVVAGAGLGLERSSALVLGGAGQLGRATVGRGGDNVYVNAANGNLVVQNTDEMLFGLGPDDIISRTHNSLTASGSSWHTNVTRRVTGLTGTLNQAGSTVKRISWDGSDVTYAWDAGKSAYVGKEGAGGYDTLTFSGATWTWTDGASRTVEAYDDANGGRITSARDADNNQLTYAYNGSGQLTRVTTADGAYTELNYTSGRLSSITTNYTENSVSKTLTRVSYGYDGSGRLTTVTVDLTPANAVDAVTYVTTYGYDGASTRVNAITQSDGSSLLIGYTLVGATYRVTQLTELAATGVSRVTGISYNTTTRVTTVTDPQSQATQLAYDTAGQLLSVTTPAPVSGGAALVTAFTYNSMGDVLEVTAPDGSKVTYTYDANGNLTLEKDGAGNTVSRTYGAQNQVLTETRYLVAAQGVTAASVPVTTRYAYDAENHLRFVVGAEGDVTEYRYGASGLQTSVTQYTTSTYDISALAETATIAVGTLETWVGTANKSATKRTDTEYDFRGNISKVTAFEKTLSDGSGDTAGLKSETVYIYDQFGKLISRQPLIASAAEVSVYDGLGRLISTTDFANRTTGIVFNDATNTTVVTLTNGLTQTSTYNKAGELISYSEAGAGVTTATTSYKYDSAGRLRIVTDAAGRSVHSLYDNVGRKIAEILPDGAITEFKYNANDQLVATVAYANKLTNTQLNALVDGSGNPTSVALATVRPTAQTTDRWNWRVYDQAQRLVETIDGAGAATIYTYDGASRVTSTKSFAKTLTAVQIAGFKTDPPTTLQLPEGASTAANLVPTTGADTLSAVQGRPVIFDPRVNDADGDGDVLTIISVNSPAHGTVLINNGVSLTYTAASNYTGPDSITYTVSDGRGGTKTGTVSVTVAASGSANHAPTAANDTLSVVGGRSLLFDPRANDGDVDADVLTIVAVAPPSHGAIVLNSGVSLSYTPTQGYVGTDSFSYTVSDGQGGTTLATISIQVLAAPPAPNEAPQAHNDALVTTQGQAVLFDPRVNDADGDGDLLTVTAVGSPAHGVAVIQNGVIRYTPTAGYLGSDSFTYSVSDGRGGTMSASIVVTVGEASPNNRAPQAVDEILTMVKDRVLVFDPRVNDLDADRDPLIVTAVGAPAHGVSVVNDGTGISYTPAAGYVGLDSFSYTVTDGYGGTVTATVTVNVIAAPATTTLGFYQPTIRLAETEVTGAAIGDALFDIPSTPHGSVLMSTPPAASFVYEIDIVEAGQTAGFIGVASQAWYDAGAHINVATPGAATWYIGATHAFGEESGATATWTNPSRALVAGDVLGVTYSANTRTARIYVNGELIGSVVASAGVAGAQMYPMIGSWVGRIAGGFRATASAHSAAYVMDAGASGGSNVAPVAGGDAITVAQRTSVLFDPRVNDGDFDGDMLTITGVGAPAHGTVTINNGVSLTYKPAAGYVGPDSFTYTISDGRGGTKTASVSVTVTPQVGNRGPVLASDTITTITSRAVIFDPRINDADADGDIVKITGVGTPGHGTVTVANGATLTYTPTPGYTGADSFTYTVSDGYGGVATATITVNVVAPPQGPGNPVSGAVADAVMAYAGQPVTLDPRINDVHSGGGQFTITAVGTPAHGSVVLNAGKTVTYTPTAGYTGADSFTYTISDGQGGASTASVSVTVSPPPGPGATPLGFYQPTVRVMESGISGTSIGATAFDIPVSSHASMLMSTPPAANFTYEITVTELGSSSGFIGVASQAWYNAGGDYSTSTPGTAHWYVGGNFSYGEASGTTATWTNASRALNPGDVLGVTYNAATRTTRVYANGQLIGTLVASASLQGVQMYPMVGSWWSRMAGSFRSSASSYASSYTMDGPANIVPTAANDTVTTGIGQSVAFDPRINDADADGDLLSITAVGAPAHGSVVINDGVSLTYTPTANFAGVDTFSYTVSDGHGGVKTATVSVTVAASGGANFYQPTVRIAESGATVGSSAFDIPATAQAAIMSAPPTQSFTYEIDMVSAQAYGSFIGVASQAWYNAGANYDTTTPGTAQWYVGATNAYGESSGATANWLDPSRVIASGDVLGVTYSAASRTARIYVNGSLIGSVVAPASLAGVQMYPMVSSWVHRVAGAFRATASSYAATYHVDGLAGPNANVAPTGVNDTITVAQRTSVIFDPRPNDTNPDGDSLTITAVGAAAHGQVVINGGASITYTPTPGYVGADSFTYTISDGRGGVSTATVQVNVTGPSNGLALAVANDAVATSQDRAVIFDPRANDSGEAPLTIMGTGTPAHGTVTINNGVSLTYTPTAGYVGSDTFTYTLSDGTGVTTTATIQVTVGPSLVPNTAPRAIYDTLTVAQRTSVVFDPRLNDTDADGDALTITGIINGGSGTVVINPDGKTITYTPPADRIGGDGFSYTISDGRGGTFSAQVVVTITAPKLNRAPTATVDTIHVKPGRTLVFDPRVNDSDADGDALRIVAVTQPAHGTVVLKDGKTIAYTPAPGYSGPDSFTYTLTDPYGAETTTTVTVTAPNAAPTAANDTLTARSAQATSFDPRVNDTDPDGNLLSVTAVSTPSHGTAVISNGVIIYTATAGYTGPDSFTYTVSDGAGATSTATVSVNVVSAQSSTSSIGFYQPTVRVKESGLSGASIGGASFDIPVAAHQSMLMSTPPSQSFSYEIDVVSAIANAGFIGVASQAWYDASGDFVTTTPGTAHWYVGQNFSYGESSGSSASWVNSGRVLNPGDVLGVTYSADTRATRIYVNGDLIGTVFASSAVQGVQMYPMIGSWAARIAGSFRASASSYASNYAVGGSVSSTPTAPSAASDTVSTARGRPVIFDPRINDGDVNGDLLEITGVGTPAHGTVTINGGVSLTYTPAAGYVGADSFTYTISDGNGGVSTATVNVNVTAPSGTNPGFYQPTIRQVDPEISASTGSTSFDIPRITNGPFPVNAAMIMSAPPAASFTYEVTINEAAANSGFIGVASQAWYNAGGGFGTATKGQGSWYVGNTHSYGESTGTTASWLNNPYRAVAAGDVVGVTYSASTATARVYVNGELIGVLALDPTMVGVQMYPFVGGWDGRIAGSYRSSPSSYAAGYELDAPDAIPNVAPTLANDAITVTQRTSVIFDPRANDVDANGDTMIITAVGYPSHGQVVINDGVSLTYTAGEAYTGPDSFTYTVTDGRGGTRTATINITVAGVVSTNQAPIAANDVVKTVQDRPVVFDPRLNDSDAEHVLLTISAVGPAAHGTVTINVGTGITYTPTPGYIGPDSFTYSVSDGAGGVTTATVNVQVDPSSVALDQDRTTRNFHDRNGRLIAVLDGEGYLTRTRYDGAGQAVETIRYGAPVAFGLRLDGSLEALTASASQPTTDVHTWSLYDGRGFVRATIDGEGGLTRYSYTASGDVSAVTTGQKLDVATLRITPPTLVGLLPAPAGAVLETTAYNRDAFGLLTSEVRTLTGGGSETTTYAYDNMRRLVGTTKAQGTSDARTSNQVYDLRGRLVRALSGEGSAALAALGANPTQAQVDAIYQTYGVIYAYDVSDRMVSMREANGVNASGNTTLYYYDANGRLTYEVNAAGEVRQHVYNSFGDRADIVVYGTRIAAGALASLVAAGGGAITTGLTNAVTANASLDSKTHYDYDVVGRVTQGLDPLSKAMSFTYNAFGEVVSQTDPIGTGVTTQTTRTYDRRGLLRSETRDATTGGLQLTTSYGYDAFGRLVQMTDAQGHVRSSAYDRAGRVLSTTDALNQTTTYTYDGRGAVLTRTDRAGKTTRFSYTAFDRQVTMTTPEGVVTTTQTNAHGETVSITDGASRTITWTYDKDGQVKTVTDAAGTTSSAYDAAGRISTITDGRGVQTLYSYDAANRILTRVVDSGSGRLNLTTSYEYDPKGQQVSVTDPAGMKTQVVFDLAGRETSVTVDHGPGRLAVATTYAYDDQGRVLTKTEAAGSAVAVRTKYAYDKAGRLTATQVDDAGLNLTTSYAYDRAGNAVARTDANGKVTRYVYDGEGRQIFAIDPTGAVTATTYDAEGRVASSRAYASLLSASAPTGPALTAAQVTANVAVSASDQLTTYVYDADGRLRFVVQPDLRVSERVYDGSGNVVRSIAYAGTIAQAQSYTAASVASAISSGGLATLAQTRVTRTVYDAANRAVFAIDAAGFVTALSYDAAGQVVKTVRYAQAYLVSATPSPSDMTTWVSGLSGSVERRTDRALYDAAGRVLFEVDALNYVTERQYDAADRVTKLIRHASAYSVSDATTTAALKSTIGSASGSAQQTTYAYDTAGRLTDVTNALGVITHMALDAMGQVLELTLAYGTSDAATTQNIYDKAGRLSAQTRAFGATEATTTAYTYDGLGRVLTLTNGRSHVTTNTYDAVGRLTSTVAPLNGSASATTSYTYDSFGNLTSVTDPRGNSGYFYYDRLNRQVLSIDPSGYATATAYSIGGEPISVTRYMFTTSGASVATPPAISTHPKDATTTFARDKLDRLTAVTDAEGYVETYELNAFGDQTAVTNKLGARTTKTYDLLGRLVSETLPIRSTRSDGSVQATAVTNTYAYDGRGNLLTQVEAAGLTEERVTTFEYDLMDRRTKKTGEAVQILSQVDLNTILSVSPVETTKYDRRGNVIEVVDATGARTVLYYDDLDRQTWRIDPVGAMTQSVYDANGNVTATRAYGDTLVTVPGAGGAPPTPINATNKRETLYEYDKANRLVKTTVQNIRTGAWNGSTYVTSLGNVSTHIEYDAAGNVIRETDGRGASVYSYYSKRGLKVGQVDQEGYLSIYARDAEGNVQRETRFATRLGATPSPSSDLAQLESALAASPNDRITTFTYDRAGRRLTETRSLVSSWTTDTNGGLTAGASGATITYAYNGLGQVTAKTEATGEQTTYAYDQMGRLTAETGPLMTNLNDFPRQKQTLNYYDALGNLTRNWVGAAGLSMPATDHVTTYAYGAGGRLASVTDAAGFARDFAYDAAGRIVRTSWTRQTSQNGGGSVTEGMTYIYDNAGRAIVQASVTLGGGAWSWEEPLRMRYDAYGAVIEQGIGTVSADLQVDYEYDSAGRLWRTNADGVVKLYVYDAAGNQTLTITGDGGPDLKVYPSIEAALSELTNNGATTVGNVALPYLVTSITSYDGRSQTTETRELGRQLSAQTSATIVQSRAYNAFGELTLETNALGGRTQYTYTTLGKVNTKQALDLTYLDRNGVAGQAPPETYYYDLSGRMVGTLNPRGALTTWRILAGSGYGGEASLITAEFHADGGRKTIGYDVFGHERVITDELGRVEQRTYDAMDRVTAIFRPARGGGTAAYSEGFTYDGLGQRLSYARYEAGSQTGVQTTDYDAQGRVAKTVDFGNVTTTYDYDWIEGSPVPGSPLGTAGGWHTTTTTTTTFSPTRASQEKVDYFGRTVWRQDEGGHAYTMTFDKAGRLIRQAGANGQDITYEYFNTGRVKKIGDITLGRMTEFSYDAAGDLTWESFKINGISHKNATSTYDAGGRRLTFHDTGIDGRSVDMAYAYTAMDDVRRVSVTYQDALSGTSTSKTYWYDYDRMNRLTVTNGVMDSNAGVTIGPDQGTAITYDLAGQRRSATSWVSGWINRQESYDYTADGYLSSVTVRENGVQTAFAQDFRDAQGRVTLHQEFETARGFVYGRQLQYNARGEIASEYSGTRQADGSELRAMTIFTYQAPGVVDHATTSYTREGGTAPVPATNTVDYTYELWDGYRQTTIANSTGGTTTFHYDVNGQVSIVSVADTKPRNISFITDGTGQTIGRFELPNPNPTNLQGPRDYFYAFGGVRVGQVGNNGPWDFDYASSIASRTAPPSTNLFRTGIQVSNAEFGQNYEPINPSSDGEAATASSYKVNEGDTLRSIARTIWGDESLWYVIADANGLNGTEPLAANRLLMIPNKVINTHNKSSTFRVYDPGDVLGNVQPEQPAPTQAVTQQAKKKGCGAVGKILMVIVAVVVTAVVAPYAIAGISNAAFSTSLTVATAGQAGLAATVAGGAVAGAAASIASQGVGIATGVQDKFSWKGVAMAAIAGGVAGGLNAGGFASEATKSTFVNGAIRSATGNAISQGVAVATGLQRKFDWTGVAMAGVVGGATDSAGGWLDRQGSFAGLNLSAGTRANQALAGTAGVIASAATQSLIDGSNFGDNVLSRLPDVIGATIGNAIAGRLRSAGGDRSGSRVVGRSSDLEGSTGVDTLIGNPNDDLLLTPAIYQPAGLGNDTLVEQVTVEAPKASLFKRLVLWPIQNAVDVGLSYVGALANGVDSDPSYQRLVAAVSLRSSMNSRSGYADPGSNILQQFAHNLGADIGFRFGQASYSSRAADFLQQNKGVINTGFENATIDAQSAGLRDRAAIQGSIALLRGVADAIPGRGLQAAFASPERAYRDNRYYGDASLGIAASFAAPESLFLRGPTTAGAGSLGLKGVGAAETAATRSRVLANIAESRAAREASAFGTHARFETAYNFYAEGGWTASRTLNHVRGIDLSKPVDVMELGAGTRVVQYQVPGAPLGNYFAPPGTSASQLGINPAGRVPNSYTATQNVPALRSTAAPILDTWSVPGAPYQATGGGTQYFTHFPPLFQ